MGNKAALAGIFLALFLAALDQTIVSTALPRIAADLHGASLYAWVATSYLLAATVAGPVFGRLTELVKARTLLCAAALIFLVGSAACGLAPSMPWLVACRGLQGIGGGGIFSTVFAVLGFMYAPRERGKMQGYFGAVWGLASVLGPFMGGFLTDHASWRWVFYLNMPVGAIALVTIWRALKDVAPSQGQPFDLPGAFALAGWTLPLVLALSLVGNPFPLFSWPILGLAALAVAGVAWFVHVERRSASPLVELGLFSLPVFRWANVTVACYGAGFLGVILFLPLYLIQARHVSASHAGLLLTPLTLGVVTTSVISGRVASRTGRYKAMVVGGLAVFVLASALAAWLLAHDASLWAVGATLVVVGLGLGPGAPMLNLAVQNGIPRERIGTATSAVLLFRQIGSTAGAAAMGALLLATLATQVPRQLPAEARPYAGPQLTKQVMGQPGAIASTVERQVPGPRGAHIATALDRAMAHGLSDAMGRIYGLNALFGLLALLAATRLANAKLRGPEEEDEAPHQEPRPRSVLIKRPQRRRPGPLFPR